MTSFTVKVALEVIDRHFQALLDLEEKIGLAEKEWMVAMKDLITKAKQLPKEEGQQVLDAILARQVENGVVLDGLQWELDEFSDEIVIHWRSSR